MSNADHLTPRFRDRLLKAIFCEGEPDRVPLVEAGIDASIKAQFIGRPITSLEDEIHFWTSAGFDFLPLETGLRTIIDAAIHHEGTGRFEKSHSDPPAIAKAKDYAKDKLIPQQLISETASGGTRTWAPEGKGFVTNLKEFDEFPWPSPLDFDFSIFQDVANILPENMGIFCFAGAIFSSVMLMMGFETCFMAIATQDEMIPKLFQRVGELQVEVVRQLLGLDVVGGIWINDDMGHNTGLLVKPDVIRKYVFPHYREIRKLTEMKGVPLLLHSDGRITELLPDLIEIGFNAIHPIDPGSMDIQETRQLVGLDVCLIGNLPLTYPLCKGTPEEVAIETENLIRMMAPGGSYCLSSANSIPDYVPYENWRAMRDTALKVGKYPIGTPE